MRYLRREGACNRAANTNFATTKRRSNGKIVGNGARDVPIAAKSGLIGKICNFAEKGGAAAIAHSDFCIKIGTSDF